MVRTAMATTEFPEFNPCALPKALSTLLVSKAPAPISWQTLGRLLKCVKLSARSSSLHQFGHVIGVIPVTTNMDSHECKPAPRPTKSPPGISAPRSTRFTVLSALGTRGVSRQKGALREFPFPGRRVPLLQRSTHLS